MSNLEKPAHIRSVRANGETYISIQDLIMWLRYVEQELRSGGVDPMSPVEVEVIEKLTSTLRDRWLEVSDP